jgi:DsbC/DsbD-like thiol-disulfide interchange protein
MVHQKTTIRVISKLSSSTRAYRAGSVATLPLLLLALPSLAGVCYAADSSPWDKGQRSAVRLITASATDGGSNPVLRAGVEIRLNKGWKTYWRYPGDSGVPPRFSFARSENVRDVTVKWPSPHRFSDESGQSIGYKEYVVFPLAVQPADPARPVTLRLDLDYAICEKLCVPAEAKVEVELSPGRTVHDPVLAVAEGRVPKRSAVGGATGLAITAVRQDVPGRVTVDVTAPGMAEVDLFAEGPTPEWALPLPEPVEGAPAGAKRFSFALDGLPPGARAAGAVLTLTAVGPQTAIEATYRLD